MTRVPFTIPLEPDMELVEIDATNEDTYYRCLHDEIPADPRVMAMRREWRAIYEPRGHRAKLLKGDDGTIVGLTNYIPIEHSPYEGELFNPDGPPVTDEELRGVLLDRYADRHPAADHNPEGG